MKLWYWQLNFAAQLYSFTHIMGFFGIVIRSSVIGLVIYLSLAKVPKSFIKTFTLNLFAFCIPCSVVSTVQNVLGIKMLYVAPTDHIWFLFCTLFVIKNIFYRSQSGPWNKPFGIFFRNSRTSGLPSQKLSPEVAWI